MKEPSKDSAAFLACVILSGLLLVAAVAIVATAPSAYRDPLSRTLAFYAAGALGGLALLSALFAALFDYLHRMTRIQFWMLMEIKNAEAGRRQQMEPVEKLAASLASKHGL